jgi:hypothetical protein
MENGILSDEKIKDFVSKAHIERSEMFHAIVKISFSGIRNLILKPISASQKYTPVHR